MCYHMKEVNKMEEEIQEKQTQEPEGYVPRPKWQVWGARVLLVVFILLLIMYYTNVFRGGA